MHGQKRAEYKHRLRDPQLAAGMAQKAQQWHALSDKSLQLRQATDGAEMSFALLDKMLRVNPDPLHLWNHRRILLLQQQDDSHNWLPGELTLTAAALERNPKAYGPWFHRKWALQQAKADASVLAAELGLTELFLQRDERNFHCWNFRRFLVGLELGSGENGGVWATSEDDEGVVIGPQISCSKKDNTTTTTSTTNTAETKAILQREWDFTQTKIVQNFSNFSAFHYRTKLLALVQPKEGWTPIPPTNDQSTLQSIAQTEWSLMENIMFTEPDDQTIWWYHRFVVDWVKTNTTSEDWYGSWLQAQAETLQMLVDDEPECKWALLGYHLVLSRMPENDEETNQKMESLLDQLMQIDPDRAQRYETLRRNNSLGAVVSAAHKAVL